MSRTIPFVIHLEFVAGILLIKDTIALSTNHTEKPPVAIPALQYGTSLRNSRIGLNITLIKVKLPTAVGSITHSLA